MKDSERRLPDIKPLKNLLFSILFCSAGGFASSLASADGLPALDSSVSGVSVPPTDPIELEQAVELAFQRNPNLQAARERIGQVQARVAEAVAAFYPQLKVGVGYTYSNNPAQAFSMIVAQRRFDFSMDINQPGFQEDFRPEIVATWSLFRGGQDYFRRQAAELGVDAATLEHAAIRNQLAAAVTAAFYAQLTAEEQTEVTRHTLETVRSELKHTQVRLEQGAVLKSDVLSLEARLAQARETQLKAQNAVELARSSLKTLLGLATDTPLKIQAPSKLQPPELDATFDELLSRALAQRPEMEAATRQVEMRRKELMAARGARLPHLDAYVVYGQNSRSPNFSLNQDNLTLGINAELDLFTGGAVSAKISAAERKLAEAQSLQQQTQLEIGDEVKRAFLTLQEAIERVRVTKAAVRAAEEALRLVREQHRGGTATITRYLEAEAASADAHMRYVSARYEALVAKAVLNQSTGYWR